MRRLCERPGCGAPAEASYGIDQINLVVWIDALDVAERESAGRLCRRHADALEGPRGWTTDDRRQPVPTLFRTKSAPTSPTPEARPRRERRPRTPAVDTPSLFESIRRDLEGAAAVEEHVTVTNDGGGTVAVDPDETKAMPWTPGLGTGRVREDDVSGSDDDPADGDRPEEDKPMFGRLLGRAFGNPAGER